MHLNTVSTFYLSFGINQLHFTSSLLGKNVDGDIDFNLSSWHVDVPPKGSKSLSGRETLPFVTKIEYILCILDWWSLRISRTFIDIITDVLTGAPSLSQSVRGSFCSSLSCWTTFKVPV